LLHARDEAFAELLHNDSQYYVTHAAPTPVEAIRTIRNSGGVAVIAHPFASRRGQILTTSTFSDLVAAGLNGIEVHHRDHNAQEQADFDWYCHRSSIWSLQAQVIITATGKLNGLARKHNSSGTMGTVGITCRCAKGCEEMNSIGAVTFATQAFVTLFVIMDPPVQPRSF
jgi:hypothetical protein